MRSTLPVIEFQKALADEDDAVGSGEENDTVPHPELGSGDYHHLSIAVLGCKVSGAGDVIGLVLDRRVDRALSLVQK